MTSTATDRILGASSSLAIKVPCVVATTANIALTGEQTIDGVAVVTGDRVLVRSQTSGVDNGIYIADTGTWERAPDADGNNDLTKGTLVKVNGGTVGQGFWYCTTSGTIIPGTTSIAFAIASSTLAVISAFVQTLLDDTTAAAFMTTLGISAFIQTVLDDADAATARATLGIKGMISGNSAGNIAAASTVFVGIAGAFAGEFSAQIVMPYAGTLKNFFTRSAAAPGGADTYTYVVRKNAADSAINSITAGTTSNDQTHSVTVAAGDLVDVKVITSATAAATNHAWSMELDPQ